jgi:protein TonB
MRKNAYRRPRGREGVPSGSPYGFRELRLIYPRQLVRAFGLAVALHLSVIGIGSVVVSLREPPHPVPGSGRVPPRDTVRIHVLPAPPPLVRDADATPNDFESEVPLDVKMAIPLPVPDLDVLTRNTIPTTDQWHALFPPAPSGHGFGIGDTLTGTLLVEDRLPSPEDFVAVEKMPVLVSIPRVEYPAIAREAGVDGTVIVHALVDKDGTVRETRVVRKVHPLLDDVAERAVSKAMFTPAVQASKPVAVWAAVPVVFRLN